MAVSDPSDLYGLPLERFVPERAALAKALRAAGRRDEAVAASALRKPSVAAWAVNQLVRTQHAALAALLEAGDDLQRAQTELLAGSVDAVALREAGRRERQAAETLAALARGLLSGDGQEPTQATVDRVTDTLHAAALDEEARARVRAGCLVRELQQVGFGGAGAGAAVPEPQRQAPAANALGPTPPAGTPDTAAAARVAEDAAQAKEAARAEAAARTEALRAARVAEADARRQAELAARQLQTAQERRERAADVLAGAEDELAGAAEHAEETAREHARAQAELQALRGS